jgi:hypothetical protein
MTPNEMEFMLNTVDWDLAEDSREGTILAVLEAFAKLATLAVANRNPEPNSLGDFRRRRAH